MGVDNSKIYFKEEVHYSKSIKEKYGVTYTQSHCPTGKLLMATLWLSCAPVIDPLYVELDIKPEIKTKKKTARVSAMLKNMRFSYHFLIAFYFHI